MSFFMFKIKKALVSTNTKIYRTFFYVNKKKKLVSTDVKIYEIRRYRTFFFDSRPCLRSNLLFFL